MRDDAWEEWEKIREEIREKIAAAGQAVQLVYRHKDDPPDSQPWMYTIGNHAVGLPELLVVDGFHEDDLELPVSVLNRLGKMQRDRGEAFADEELVSVGGKYPLRIVDAGEIGRAKYATLVGLYYGTRDYEVRQVVAPDTQGRWPETPGCEVPFARQPILSRIGRTAH